MKIKQIAIATAAALSLGTAFANDTTGSSSTSYNSQDQSASIGAQSSGTMSTQDKDLVRQVQQNLQSKGYNPGPIDGQFGSRTQAALKKFQKAQGAQASGSLDSTTLVALGVNQGSDTSSSMNSNSGTSGSDTSTSNSTTGSSGMNSNSGMAGTMPSTGTSSATPSTGTTSSTPSNTTTGSSSVNSTGAGATSNSYPSGGSSSDSTSSTSGTSPSR